MITHPFYGLSSPHLSTSVSSSLSSRFLSIRLCTANIGALGAPFSAIVPSQSRFEINPDGYPISAESSHLSIRSPWSVRHLLDVCASDFASPIQTRLLIHWAVFYSHNYSLISILTSHHFLQTPITPQFDPRVLLAIFSVLCPSGFASQINARLVILSMLCCSHSLALTSI